MKNASPKTKLMEHYVAGTTTRCASDLVGLNFKTAAYYFHRLQEIIALETQNTDVLSNGDESYFGGGRQGHRGRGAEGKVPVFGILKRGSMVYTQVIPNAFGQTHIPIIEDRTMPDSIEYSDYSRVYNVFDVSEFKHCRINHSVLFVTKKNHINGIENFWNQAKRHMRKFNSILAKGFPLFLEQWEWRFNNQSPQTQLKKVNRWINKYMG